MKSRFFSFFIMLLALLMLAAACTGNNKPVETAAPGDQQALTSAEPLVTEAPSDVPAAEPTEEPAAASDSTPIYIRKPFVMDPGELSVSVNVLKWIADEGYGTGSEYEVLCEIRFCPGAGEYEYNGKTLGEYRNDPALAAFNKEYKAWFIDTFVKEFADAYPLAKNGDEAASAIVFGDIYERFYEEWSGRQNEETIRAYNEAYANYNDACESYRENGWQDPSGTDHEEAFAQELARLASLGYEFEPVEDTHEGNYAFLHGSLTIDQIWSFTADAEWEYYLMPFSDQYGIDE